MLVISDYLPTYGLTKDFLEQANSKRSIFVEGPVFVMGFGTVYYICLAIFNFWVVRNPEKLEKEM